MLVNEFLNEVELLVVLPEELSEQETVAELGLYTVYFLGKLHFVVEPA